MALSVKPLSEALGAEISGVDLPSQMEDGGSHDVG